MGVEISPEDVVEEVKKEQWVVVEKVVDRYYDGEVEDKNSDEVEGLNKFHGGVEADGHHTVLEDDGLCDEVSVAVHYGGVADDTGVEKGTGNK